MQKFTDKYMGKFYDVNIFFTSLVPLQLISIDEIKNSKLVLYEKIVVLRPELRRGLVGKLWK